MCHWSQQIWACIVPVYVMIIWLVYSKRCLNGSMRLIAQDTAPIKPRSLSTSTNMLGYNALTCFAIELNKSALVGFSFQSQVHSTSSLARCQQCSCWRPFNGSYLCRIPPLDEARDASCTLWHFGICDWNTHCIGSLAEKLPNQTWIYNFAGTREKSIIYRVKS